jgi:hypothetical protein
MADPSVTNAEQALAKLWKQYIALGGTESGGADGAMAKYGDLYAQICKLEKRVAQEKRHRDVSIQGMGLERSF